MPYPGISKEKEKKMDRCVNKVMKDGKSKSSAIAICRTSIMSQTEQSKEEKEPYKVVESSNNHYVFSTSSKINASKEGTTVKDIEIFKAGTFKGVEFKQSALDKMVANFYFLKVHNIFPNVPMRADHPGWMSGGEVDKIGGYVTELRRIGKKLIADVRFTSEEMLKKVKEGTYISRSSEIGGYVDNEGTVYNPILYGFAWVDIPAVEGLSPQFSFSKDKNVELINLNEEIMGEEDKNFPPVEKSEETEAEKAEEKEEESTEEKKEVAEEKEKSAEETKEKEEISGEEKTALSKNKESVDFAKLFPKEAEELKKFKEQELVGFVNELVTSGRILPVQKEKEMAFVKNLTAEQFSKYKELRNASPAIVKLNDEGVEDGDESQEKPGSSTEKTSSEKADEFLKEVKN